jgi:hypothetical protein
MQHVNRNIADYRQADPTPFHVANFAGNVMEPRVLQNPYHADERQQICDPNNRPGSEPVCALSGPQFSGLSAQVDSMIAPIPEAP